MRQNLQRTDRSSALFPSLGPSVPGTTLDNCYACSTQKEDTITTYLSGVRFRTKHLLRVQISNEYDKNTMIDELVVAEKI